jgi:uncharacterized protein (TIGR03000 family)
MIRILATAALALAIAADARAQVMIHSHSIAHPPRPAGVIPPVRLPATVPQRVPGHRFFVNPYYGLWGYAPIWPDGYETTPTIVNNFIPVPVPIIPIAPPAPPPELRARLTLNVPSGAHVWLGDKEVDAAISPLVLESPALEEGQSYTFDVKVKWQEGRNAEERTRKVTVEAGEGKSLTYTAVR